MALDLLHNHPLVVNSMRRFFFIILMVLLYTTDKAHALVINTNKMTVFYGKDMAILEGRVEVRQEGAILQANKATIKYSKDTKGVEQIEAVGNVSIKNEDIDASGDTAIYSHKTTTVELRGRVVVNSKDGKIHGEVLTYNLHSKKAIIDGGVEGVRLRIYD